MVENMLIEASAGTGKTQALATRLIELLRLGVKPHEIVALTFSRLASGEIFERFVSLLAESAAKNPADVKLLRETIATQHLSQIGTLDGYLFRIVRSFPLELGLVGDLKIMGKYDEESEISRVSFSILRRTDPAAKKAFSDAFAYAMGGRNVRRFIDRYRQFIHDWHEIYLALPGPQGLGDPSAIWDPVPAFVNATRQTLACAADSLAPLCSHAKWPDFVDEVRNFGGSFSGSKGLMKKFLECESLFDGATIDITFSRKALTFGGEDAKTIRVAFLAMFGFAIRQKLDHAFGVRSLMSEYEREYDAKVRRAGRLVFADIPRLIASLPEGARRALEYRLDSAIRGWALDEFQDTSREQWRALGELIGEAKMSGGDKSIFIVGDSKQAIYGWRNGDVSIFRREKESGDYKVDSLDKSYRYGQPMVDAVNAIFRDGRISAEFPAWKCPKHETAKKSLGGFVQRVEASGSLPEDFVEPVRNAIEAVDPVRRGISAAILVRSNAMGELLAAKLKDAGVEGVVWEGESAILDTPALMPFLDLVMLSDHPGDKQSYRHFKTTPLARAKYPDGVPEAEAVSCEFAREFTERGFVRTFRELRALLPSAPDEAWSRFTEMRFTDMLRAAAEFELAMQPSTRRGDFLAFLQNQTKRNIAEPGKIRILTIHRSKGLGFDYVIVPLYEKSGLLSSGSGNLVSERWALPALDPVVSRNDAVLREVWQRTKDAEEQEELCIYYVALTRAKRAMTLVLHPQPKSGESLRFSDLVRGSMPEEIGDRRWYESFVPEKKEKGPASAQPEGAEVFARGPRKAMRRRLPSSSFHDGMSAGDLFVRDAGREAAMKRGTDVHAQYEAIEWIDADKASGAVERELVRPDGFVELWRERKYEVMEGGEWESGQIDRAVFTRGEDGSLSAVVYDYKTNRMMRGETPEDFHERMARTYAGQLRSYARAVSALAGIPRGRIATKLLLLSTDEVLTIE